MTGVSDTVLRSVMYLENVSERGGDVEFSNRASADDPALKDRRVILERGAWVDLGEPDTITVRVVAGDALNADARRDGPDVDP